MIIITKVCLIISNINKALAFEWIADYLDKEKIELHFLLLNPGGSMLENFLSDRGTPFHRITFQGKKSLPGAIINIYKYLKKNKIKVVHCHLFEANIAGLIASKLLNIKKRIYTRHYSTLHHQYFPRAVYYDKFINWLSTDIVAISNNVKNVLIEKEGVATDKIHLIHHGFDLRKFLEINPAKVDQLKRKYVVIGHYPVIGVISRYEELKGIQYIIPAFKELLYHYPQAKLILANASGNYKNEIQHQLSELPEKSYTEIPFEEDIYSFYQLFDVFVHVPVNRQIEAFGQTYVEALVAGVPSVFTISGVASEFIKNQENALVVAYEDSDKIFMAMIEMLKNKTLVENLVANGKRSVEGLFKISVMIKKLESLYQDIQK